MRDSKGRFIKGNPGFWLGKKRIFTWSMSYPRPSKKTGKNIKCFLNGCEKEKYFKAYYILEHKKFFCCKEHAWLSQKGIKPYNSTSIYNICGFCKKSFKIPLSKIKLNWGKFCSKECYTKSSQASFICEICGIQKNIPLSHSKWRKSCSLKCNKERYRLISLASFKRITELRKIRGLGLYNQWKKQIFIRDKFICVLCKYKSVGKINGRADIQADHIKSFTLYPDLRFDINNGRTLCLSCHKKTGTWGKAIL